MSEPKRYDNFQYETKGGEYVRYEDYAHLRSEVERLQNNCDYLDQKLDEEIDKSAMLCGKVERLTRAGDSLVLSVEWRNVVVDDPTLTFFAVKPDCLCNCHNFDFDIKLWNNAKVGKGQP